MQTSIDKPSTSAHKATTLGVPGLLLSSANAVTSAIQTPLTRDGDLCQGWMLKKKRKKMQGYARRYFVLSSSGVLSYSFEPGAPVRDQIHLKLASISSSASERTRAIHIDSGEATFHLRALSVAEYTIWMSALRRFCTFGTHTSEEMGVSPRTGRLSIGRSGAASFSITGPTARLARVSYELGTTIKDLEGQLLELNEEEFRSRRNSSQFKHKKEKDKDRDYHGKDKDKEGLFGLFHRKGHHSSPTPPITPSSSSQDTQYTDALGLLSPPLSTPSATPPSAINKLMSTVAVLRAQHNSLVALLEGPSLNSSGLSTSPLHSTVEEFPQHVSTPDSSRLSMGTFKSSASIWFDAMSDGAEEFVLQEDEPEDSRQELTISNASSSDVLDEEDEGTATVSVRSSAEEVSSMEAPLTPRNDGTAYHTPSKVMVRRSKLPAPATGDDGSLLAMLRKNVGKDLSTVSFPVSFNEPISILQRLAEDVQYTDLLREAVAASDPIDRICLISAFAVSGYACTLHRASRKPFNPMLGETYEYYGDMKFIAEKVSHHPPVMAVYAEGPGWEYWATSGAESKFWGRSLEIINHGTTHVKIGDSHYQWQRPSSFMRNLIVGEKYLAHEGEMVIQDKSSGYRSVITFKEAGYWGATRNGVSATIHSGSSSKALAKIEGTWSEGLNRTVDSSGSNLRVLWRAHPFPSNSRQYYGFTSFTMGLNEITPDIVAYLPPTDSRYRPDQQAMEYGRIDEADREKERVEIAQRQRRKELQDRGGTWQPNWFEKAADGEWIYKGGYWETRAAKKWPLMEPLW